MSSNSSAYPYTLQPLPYSLSVEEQQDAQFLLWQAGNVISRKTWLILAAICAAAIVGIVLVNGYSTVIFWPGASPEISTSTAAPAALARSEG